MLRIPAHEAYLYDTDPTLLPFSTSESSEASVAEPHEVFAATKKKYKPVAKKVRPVISEMPDKFRIVRNIVGDPLADLPELDPRPAPFKPGTRYTEARRAAVRENHQEFLWPAELDILDDLILKAEKGFAWTESERGAFSTDFFPGTL